MTDELEPCPVSWCTEPTPRVQTRSASIFVVRCNECGTTTPYFHTEAEAIAAWNTRPTPSPDGIREALEELERSASCALDTIDSYNSKEGTFLVGGGLIKLAKSVAKARAALTQPQPSEAVRPVGDGSRHAITIVKETFERWLEIGSNAQPHYPNGLRPFSNGDLSYLIQGLSAALIEARASAVEGEG